MITPKNSSQDISIVDGDTGETIHYVLRVNLRNSTVTKVKEESGKLAVEKDRFVEETLSFERIEATKEGDKYVKAVCYRRKT